MVKINRIPSSLVLSFLLRAGNPSQNGGDPGRRIAEISKQRLFVADGQLLLQIGHNGIVHLPLPEMAQRMDDQPGDPPGRGHGPGRRVLEHDDLLADLNAARRSVGEKHNLHGHLIGEPQQIGGIAPGRLQKDLVPPFERLDNGVYGRGKEAERRIDARVVVQSAGQTAQRPFLRQPVQRQVHGLPAPEVQKVSWGDDTTFPTTVYAT